MLQEFDEAAYLRANPDVASMVQGGLFASGHDHWLVAGAHEHSLGHRRSGFYEHDVIYDEASYLAQNVDVQELIRQRKIYTGYEHWMRFGRVEFAKGVRWGPFAAPGGRVRPFRVPVPGRGAFLCGTAPGADGTLGPVTVRVGVTKAVQVDPSDAAATEPVRIVDACDRASAIPLLVVFLADADREARPITVSAGEGGAVTSLTFHDSGKQAFFFGEPDASSAFARAAVGLPVCDGPGGSALALAATNFAIDRLRGLHPAHGQPASGLHLERLFPHAGGLHASGWIFPDRSLVKRVRAWCPETAWCEDVTAKLAWIARPDVAAAVGDSTELAGATPDGFDVDLAMDPAPLRNGARLLFGVTPEGGAERWVIANTGVLAAGG